MTSYSFFDILNNSSLIEKEYNMIKFIDDFKKSLIRIEKRQKENDTKINKLIKSNSKAVSKTKTRKYLVAFNWSNEITKASGFSSTIITLGSKEKMNGAKIMSLQTEILKKITTVGHVNDPDNLVITSFTLLE